jgi:mono/diheme cytochrome c family protein
MKLRRIRLVCLVALVCCGALVLAAARGAKPQAKPVAKAEAASAGKFKVTPARLARGKYLVNNVAHCDDCHSDVNWKAPGAPTKPGRFLVGTKFVEEGLPFPIYTRNLTPDKETGLGLWTDQEIARAIREGVSRDGHRLFPLMPYMNFRKMSDEDVESIVVYLRTIPAVHNDVPKNVIPPEFQAAIPPHQPITSPVPPPDFSNPVKRGEYLVTLADCYGCHTPVNQQGMPLPGMDFGGGQPLVGPWGSVNSANITPSASGISYYDEALFMQTLRTGMVKTRKLSVIMPWPYFRHMTDADLKGIFAYLRTVKPVEHVVDNTEPPAMCTKCGYKHGYGDRNKGAGPPKKN